MKTYAACNPCQAIDGKWYVANDFVSEVDTSHLDFERSRGNLHEVAYCSTVEREEDIPAGSLVCFGNRVSVWKIVQGEGKQ